MFTRSGRKSVSFYRDFHSYTGGHQKVADYFAHLQSAPDFEVGIAFSPSSRWDSSNPWFPVYQHNSQSYLPADYDYAFIAGMDWLAYLAATPDRQQPVVNLIQHVRHADPSQPMHQFLSERAIRVCVSPEVAGVIRATGMANGPLITIANGIDIPLVQLLDKSRDLFIFGPKNPQMAIELHESLQRLGIHAFCITDWIPRGELLSLIASSRIVVLLPSETEGFYLPALESMRYADLTVVPDCVGNRSFCHDRQNCLLPAYNTPALVAAIIDALQLLDQPEQLNIFKRNCADTLTYHSLERERTEFLGLMRQVDELWRSI